MVARVNGEAVTRAELRRLVASPSARPRLLKELGSEQPEPAELDRLALRKLIQRRLLLQEAARRGISVAEDELDEAIGSLRRRFSDLRSFGDWMKDQGLDDRGLFDSVRSDMLVSRVWAALADGVSVSDEDVRRHYEAHREELKTEEVRLQLIVVKDRAEAEEILKAAVEKHEDFGRLARQRSLGIRAAGGGDTGWVDSATLSPPLRALVATLEPRQATGPLQRGDDGLLLVRLHDRRAGRPQTLAEALAEIERILLARSRDERIRSWLGEQEARSVIEVLL